VHALGQRAQQGAGGLVAARAVVPSLYGLAWVLLAGLGLHFVKVIIVLVLEKLLIDSFAPRADSAACLLFLFVLGVLLSQLGQPSLRDPAARLVRGLYVR